MINPLFLNCLVFLDILDEFVSFFLGGVGEFLKIKLGLRLPTMTSHKPLKKWELCALG